MKRIFFRYLSLPILFLPSLLPAVAGPQWAHESSDIQVDPALKLGELENGMRYVILRNAEPPGKASLRLHISAGSLMEAENQRGLAHFLEHMVFNGSRHFKPGELIPKMQRMGLGFGGHANAYTSFDETVYMLDLPNSQEDMMDLTFTIMRDFADGALLLEPELDKERGVIIKELESRDSVDWRMQEEAFKKLFKGSRIPERLPIGLREVITGAARQRFVDFYQQYYVPSRMTFIVVGDVQAADIERRIRETFGSMKQPANAGGDPDLGQVEDGGNEVFFVTDEEASKNDIELISHHPYSPAPDTIAERIKEMPLQLANAMLNRRLSRLAKEEGAPFSKASAGYSEFFKAGEVASLSITANTSDDWDACLKIAEQELRRAIEFGFLESEFKELKADMMSAAENAVKAVESRKSSDLAMALVSSLDDRVFTRPEEELRILKQALEKIDLKSCRKELEAAWNFDKMDILLSGKPSLERSPDEVLKVLRESQGTTLEQRKEESLAAFAYGELADAGAIKASREFPELGVTQVEFSNGLILNFKATDFEKNTIRLQLRFGNGKISMPKNKPGLELYAQALFNGGGLEAHSAEDLERLFAGRSVETGLAIEDDHFVLGGKTRPEDLELQLKLMQASLLHPGYRVEAERQLDKVLPMMFDQLEHSAEGVLQMKVMPAQAGGDPRFVFPNLEQLLTYVPEDASSWLQPSLFGAPLELSVVGDFDVETLKNLVARTFGALPTRSALDAEKELSIQMPVSGELKILEFESKVDRGFSIALWNLGDDEDYRRLRRLNVLGDVLGDRLRETIREELGEAYSPMSQLQPSRGVKGMNFIMALSPGNRESSAEVAKLLREIGAKLAAEGVSQDELDRALKPLLSDLEKTRRSNNYWLGTVLSGCSCEEWHLQAARDMEQDYASITKEELSQLAAEFLAPERCQTFAIRPAAGDAQE